MISCLGRGSWREIAGGDRESVEWVRGHLVKPEQAQAQNLFALWSHRLSLEISALQPSDPQTRVPAWPAGSGGLLHWHRSLATHPGPGHLLSCLYSGGGILLAHQLQPGHTNKLPLLSGGLSHAFSNEVRILFKFVFPWVSRSPRIILGFLISYTLLSELIIILFHFLCLTYCVVFISLLDSDCYRMRRILHKETLFLALKLEGLLHKECG